jgi:hypothetical protein
MDSQDILTLCVPCRNGLDVEDGGGIEETSQGAISALILTKMIIAQILEKKPDLVIRTPGILNERAMGSLNSFEKGWALLRRILAEVDEHVLLVINRIDGCVDDEVSKIDEQLPPEAC